MKLGLRFIPVPASAKVGALFDMLRVPEEVDWFAEAARRTGVAICDGDALANDVRSNCVECGAFRYLQIVRAIAKGDARKPTADQALALYRLWAGWDGTDATDRGTMSTQAAALWAEKGIWWDSQDEDVPSVIPLDVSNAAHLRAAIAFFGPIQLDVAMPLAWKDTTLTAQADGRMPVWVVDNGPNGQPGSWGAHRVCGARFDRANIYDVSWGIQVQMPWDAVARYGLGAWACVSRSWLNIAGLSPTGLSIEALEREGHVLSA